MLTGGCCVGHGKKTFLSRVDAVRLVPPGSSGKKEI